MLVRVVPTELAIPAMWRLGYALVTADEGLLVFIHSDRPLDPVTLDFNLGFIPHDPLLVILDKQGVVRTSFLRLSGRSSNDLIATRQC